MVHLLSPSCVLSGLVLREEEGGKCSAFVVEVNQTKPRATNHSCTPELGGPIPADGHLASLPVTHPIQRFRVLLLLIL